ncbi:MULTISPECIES: substrate-binding domain-containing protein [unclassified Symbiopectobacterium]|uniref:LacI family DNA-binding transcriptional regulator n=1 Tax=unclassified Symbiopectobacterium TaxID=2794573 RepID=UPI002227A540|nr:MULTISPECIES: substrate-binding domain-containing protein [unclassified Symbiopectobacterium]MCW2473220.1 substrate-binding domain-containing protein [Candidatus Symbiopectobacterium sp. NZEC151]MCW2484392.1 substrate-binding domain-containing protein [Candidatus Symbiopectobacterium sp. NZEC127]
MSESSYSKNSGFASAAEVAQLAGVSRSAVSRTFTPGSSVSAETRRKVLAAAQTLNYHVNHLARGLSKEACRPVCILGGNLAAPYQASLLEHLTRRLNHAGRAVMVINTDDGEESVREALQQTLNYRSTATIVLSGKPPGALIETCLQSGQQVILINRMGQFSGADNIEIDYRSTMADALNLLLTAGCQQIALVSSSARSPSMVLRETRFLDAAAERGINVTLTQPGSASYLTGAAAARELLNAESRPDGVFCVTDLLACGFIDVARHEFGLRIPEDISVIGFDDIEQASWLGYDLTTFAQPLSEMAEAACQLVIAPATGTPSRHVFNALPVRRSSLR